MKGILLLLMLFNFAMAANEVEILVVPNQPVKGEEFNVEFVLKGDYDEDTNISFNPMGVEVLEQRLSGRSTRTTYINGRLTVEKRISVTYTMIANSSGIVYLNDIRVESKGKTERIPNKSITIVNQPTKPTEVFAIAIPSKTEVYAGESIVVRYYIYNSLPLHDFKIDKYAKLDKFLKRFHQEQTGVERVNHNGQLYTRRVIYSAQLYATQPGTYKIDPMEFTVRYSSGRSLDPFNQIFSGGSSRSKTIRSPLIEIKVKPLPVENVPSDFTGLVGKHEFELQMNRSKFLTNEPIELKFTAKGPGALEIYESPKILTNPELEEFVSDADLNLNQDFTATKTFSMTYLGRSALEIPKKELSFSYFDPDLEQFVSQKIEFPGIQIIAGQASGRARTEQPASSGSEDPVTSETQNKVSSDMNEYFKPVYYFENTYLRYAKHLNWALFILLISTLLFKGYEFVAMKRLKAEYSHIELLKNRGVDYRNLYNVVHLLGEGSDMQDIISKSKLSDNAKQYLQNLVAECEREYLEKGKVRNKKIKLKYLKEIIRVVS